MLVRFFFGTTLACALSGLAQGAGNPAQQEQARGFLEGSSLDLNLRHYYANQHARRSTYLTIQKPQGRVPTRTRETWVQASMLKLSSGYTQGTLGFGLDAGIFSAVNLARGHGQVANGADRVLVDSSGDAIPTWSRLGLGIARFRVSNTELKVGRQMTENPILRYKDNRALPSSFQGAGLSSNETDWLSLQAGSFDRVIPRTGTGAERLTSGFGNRQYSGDRISYVGGTLKPGYGLEATLYASRFENMWDQYYFGAIHRAGDNATLGTRIAFGYYHTREQGEQRLGYIDNSAYSIALTGSHQAHSVTLAWQQVIGNEYFDTVWESTGNYLANSLYSEYSGPNEKSWQLRYEVDLVSVGLPGLTAATWHAKGWDIDGTHYDGDRNGRNTGYNVRTLDGAKHHENALMVTYTVQSGRLKNSTLRTIIYNHRASGGQIDGSYDEFRLVGNFPIN